LSVLVSPAAGIPHEAEQDDGCSPALCALGARPHEHCVCGLPMPVNARLCSLCLAEGLRRPRRRQVESSDEWDGRSYPSRRQHRCGTPHPDAHLNLLTAILAPATETEKGTRA
jgi:hypothetical protein